MKSLRLSLILYFLLLLVAALGGVSYFCFQSTQVALQSQEASIRDLNLKQYQVNCTRVKVEFDKDLLNQAKDLAEKSRWISNHYEGLVCLSLLTTNLQFHGYLQAPFLLLPSYYQLDRRHPMEWRMRSFEIHLVGGEEEALNPLDVEEGLYFQSFRLRGQHLERSRTMKDLNFQLSDEIRRKVDGNGVFDTVELSPGLMVRRVTVKVPVGGYRAGVNIPTLRAMGGKGLKGPPFPFPRPEFIIQFASKTDSLEESLAILKNNLDRDNAHLQEKLATAQADLGSRLLGIGLGAFVALLAGGWFLVNLGLFPLKRLTEAVRQVSAKDFRLPLDPQQLPGELKPIANRLVETLEELKRAFAREKQASADISHELRTPLATLLTTIDVSLNKPRTPEYYREILEECRASGMHMNTLVERLLTLARLDAGAASIRPYEVDVANLVTQCADLVRPLARARNLNLRVHSKGPAILQADPEKLREVINNLLSNAIEYNRPNGAVDLTVGRENGHLTLEVRDTGIGIPAEARARIFERFFRADPSRQAEGVHAGLGLSIVKGYVDLMGGTIGVDSSDAGSTFRVQLPVRG